MQESSKDQYPFFIQLPCWMEINHEDQQQGSCNSILPNSAHKERADLKGDQP